MAGQQEFESDVVIVGGGPVGMGLAIELGQRGVDVTVIERYETPQQIPKGQNLTQRTMEHFHFWGAEKELRAARTIPPEYGIGGLTSYGTLLSGHHYDWLKRQLVRSFYYTENERLPQYETERVLRDRAAQLPSVRTLYGCEAEALEVDAAGVTANVRRREDNASLRLSGRYLVGCDGSRSMAREQAGIAVERSDHDRLMVLIVFRSSGLHELLKRYPGKSFYNVLNPELKGYWQFFGRVDLGNSWFFHAPVPPDTTKDNFDFRTYLHRAVGAEFDIAFDHIGFWDLRVTTAERYREGPVFIAGDAAHSHPPYGGYGINTGFEDARNLGWKLAACLEGWGGAQLLDSYDAERRPVFISTARDFIETAIENDRDFLEHFDPEKDPAAFDREWKARSSGATSEVHAYEPNYRGSPIVCGPSDTGPSAQGKHAVTARAGHHLTPHALSDGADIYDRLAPGFTLIALDASSEDVAAFRHAANRANVPLLVISDSACDGRERFEARLILVRPDQFVAWTGDRADGEAEAIIRRAIGAI